MRKLILASNNQKKIKEIKEILSNIDIEVRSLKDENIDIDVVEDKGTFEGNARKKATEIREYLINKGNKDFIVMSDDSGLEVDYLNGEPGVYSARYSGEHGNDTKNNEKLLKELENVPMEKRDAKFVCHITLINGDGKELNVRGEVKGKILENLNGSGGFGYDPLFYYEDCGKTFGEMSAEEKNKISHRGKALKKLKERIYEVI
ncbi:non-canonical purine NTP pyrophosphatase, RdgB/HAM1 family [Clostridium baratii]|uniref:XTP/dITP diphosphatase n=1 Tax=Clostridium baratii TaxID=1561 RepID=UPI0009A33641|nr:XTP/dITP diphosphatase [Clostridium baratii]OPF52119.1 non-canonical purine NTP pyrophosphatase [Clostridium baratii]OPF56605.1 non-canonical purine NTP pyrophosphatase, RdgB/HAM1 family [Clostridium baratii]OPF57865.1 non-canonical purine NTP pyrophosphatase, RdgB/HAM1 family [Clostridium baratii]OPF58483.1 non-canonical purine NTP pyrophosphatase, RdgB/HAM1 family [Clostridium baratii]